MLFIHAKNRGVSSCLSINLSVVEKAEILFVQLNFTRYQDDYLSLVRNLPILVHQIMLL